MNKIDIPTNQTLFEKIKDILKKEGKIPSILDYFLDENYHICEIKGYEFDIRMNVSYGCEGIYLDLYLDGNLGYGIQQKVSLGTAKTLDASDEAMRTMAVLGADFISTGIRYINENLDDFTWTGYKISFFDETRKLVYAVSTKRSDIEARRLCHEFFREVNICAVKAVVRDNATRKEFEMHPDMKDIQFLWEAFGDLPMDPETECIEKKFRHFPAGTHREDIWRYFEDVFDVQVADLL